MQHTNIIIQVCDYIQCHLFIPTKFDKEGYHQYYIFCQTGLGIKEEEKMCKLLPFLADLTKLYTSCTFLRPINCLFTNIFAQPKNYSCLLVPPILPERGVWSSKSSVPAEIDFGVFLLETPTVNLVFPLPPCFLYSFWISETFVDKSLTPGHLESFPLSDPSVQCPLIRGRTFPYHFIVLL